ncbi:uncharacterized protein BXZ73DRAFT_76884 [Epithele typhae]|uniref:uncharacterized protein n=1 Tax=Epithele typhae TaxID=378194 RepID=UPI002007B60C|nr:uncharacterized protein BXZ73DRAFT_76884 [Epithele typhae]KAH9935186.1 hypothetical protein BXZ73DRAFT_76884 [Epithele typhae]
MPDILVLGATGYTGRFTIKALDEHPQRDQFTYTSRTVVINWRGRIGYMGRMCRVSEAEAVLQKGLYTDTSLPVTSFDYLATKTGAILIPACGFDSIPSDILVHLSNRTIKNALGPTAALGLSQTYFSVGGGFSGGSVASLMAELEQVPGHLAKEARSDWSLSPGASSYCSSSSSRLKPGASNSAWSPMSDTLPRHARAFYVPQQYAGWWVIAAPNRGCVQRTWGLNELAVAATSSASVKERKFRYVEYFVTGTSKVTATAVSVGILVFFTLVTYCAPVRWLFKMLMLLQDLTCQGGHMGNHECYRVCVFTGRVRQITMRGTGNVGYYKTAYMLVESALALLLDDASLPEAARAGGVLTPSTPSGVSWLAVSRRTRRSSSKAR